MKLVIREYLASLRERGELDAILPNLLIEMGLTVFSRPAVGVRQYGVDIGAVGPGPDGFRRVYLFSVKSGDLGRSDWNTGSPQSLRPSLDEIQDVYLRSHLPIEFAKLPVRICLCFGGDVAQDVRAEVSNYIARYTTEKVGFEEWNGDRLAEAILQGILREDLLPPSLRGHLRKAAAMVEEPDIAVKHFSALLRAVRADIPDKPRERLARARLINICLWIVFVWAREANNLEAPYRLSELAMLITWDILAIDFGKATKGSEAAGIVFRELVDLHISIWTQLYGEKLLPHADTRHALSAAGALYSPTDVNLRLFDTLGRLALRGLWLVWETSGTAQLPVQLPDTSPAPDQTAEQKADYIKLIHEIDDLSSQIAQIIFNNRALLSPIGDWQAIEIGLAFSLLAIRAQFHGVLVEWIKALTDRAIFTYRSHGQYPIHSTSYWDLAGHPAQQTNEYRKEMTQGSILHPLLALWATVMNETESLEKLANFTKTDLEHCTLQAWFPGDDSEDRIYLNKGSHGLALTHIPIKAGTRATYDFIFEEVDAGSHFDTLSAIKMGHWPVLLTACRHYRLPIPANLWRDLFMGFSATTAAEDASPEPQQEAGVPGDRP